MKSEIKINLPETFTVLYLWNLVSLLCSKNDMTLSEKFRIITDGGWEVAIPKGATSIELRDILYSIPDDEVCRCQYSWDSNLYLSYELHELDKDIHE